MAFYDILKLCDEELPQSQQVDLCNCKVVQYLLKTFSWVFNEIKMTDY